jgi:hypothetical protein
MTPQPESDPAPAYDPSKDPAVSFLSADYDYACSQMKYYDTQINDYVKYLFTAYASIISVVAILEKFGITAANDNTLGAAQLLLFIGFCIGVLLVILIVRTRIYFVVMARYANALRDFFLTKQKESYGFTNPSHMWVSHDQPSFRLNPRSAHTWLVIIPILMNSVVFGVLAFLFVKSWNSGTFITLLPGIVMFVMQIAAIWWYQNSRIDVSDVELRFAAGK